VLTGRLRQALYRAKCVTHFTSFDPHDIPFEVDYHYSHVNNEQTDSQTLNKVPKTAQQVDTKNILLVISPHIKPEEQSDHLVVFFSSQWGLEAHHISNSKRLFMFKYTKK
jgi:hypothetical protein